MQRGIDSVHRSRLRPTSGRLDRQGPDRTRPSLQAARLLPGRLSDRQEPERAGLRHRHRPAVASQTQELARRGRADFRLLAIEAHRLPSRSQPGQRSAHPLRRARRWAALRRLVPGKTIGLHHLRDHHGLELCVSAAQAIAIGSSNCSLLRLRLSNATRSLVDGARRCIVRGRPPALLYAHAVPGENDARSGPLNLSAPSHHFREPTVSDSRTRAPHCAVRSASCAPCRSKCNSWLRNATTSSGSCCMAHCA